jgi:hypothetical protein
VTTVLTAPPADITNTASSVSTSSTSVTALSVPSSSSTSTGSGLTVLPNANQTLAPDDNLFVDVLISQNGANDPVVIQTKALFNGIIDASVSDQTIPALVTSWQKVIPSFVKQFDASPVGDLRAMTGLIELHSLLESLYDQLLSNITQTSGDSLDSRILSIY